MTRTARDSNGLGATQWALWMLCALWLSACGGDKNNEQSAAEGAKAEGAKAEGEAKEGPTLKVGQGIDLEKKIIRLGALNDESGPAATIGKPYAVGKRILIERVNAGGTGLLPEGWKVELVEKDHGYNPQKSVQAYNQIKDDVALIMTSFGTPNTLPLRPMLKRDKLVVLPASLASSMAEHEYTPPYAASYVLESMRAMDFVVDQVKAAGGTPADIKAGVIYQQDDYGMDGFKGWKEAAKHHGVQIVSEQTITPGQRDFAAVVTGLKEAGATHVLLTVLPSASAPLLGTAAQLEYSPMWLGQSPSWVDRFFDPKVVPSAVFANFYLVSSLPRWGEDLPDMPAFMAAYEKWGKQHVEPDSYVLQSYLQGMLGLEVLKRAIESGDATRPGILKALQTIEKYDASKMVPPITLTKFPYVTSTVCRVTKPNFETRRSDVVGDYQTPKTLEDADGTKAASL